MDEILDILTEIGLPFAYHHFAEGEAPDPPFICYLTPGSDNFAADGKVYFKIAACTSRPRWSISSCTPT